MGPRSTDAYKRNFGFWNEPRQEALAKSKVSIGGVGGDGFQLGVRLAMMGVGHISVADPEVFEIENSNRVFGATSKNYGRLKAEVFRETVLELRPDAIVDIFTDGVTKDNVDAFMQGSDLVLDETELTYLEVGTMVAREARKKNIPDLLVMNIGFGAIATSFNPKSKNTFEKMMGVPEGMPLDEVAEMSVDFSRCLPYVPEYADFSTFVAVQGGASLPSISPGVDAASAIGSTQAFLHLTAGVDKRARKPTWSPKFSYMDAYNGKGGQINFPRVSHYLGLAAMAARTQLGLNPRASYRQAERDARE